jgi:hypothetical protein
MSKTGSEVKPLTDRLRRARKLFSVDEEGRDVLAIMFNCLETELCRRSTFADLDSYSGAKAKTLANFCLYTTQRLEELLIQLSQLEWMREKLISAQNQEKGLWHLFAPLSVKGFHNGVVSLMDSLAPLSIAIHDSLESDEQRRLPYLPDTLKAKNSRQRIPATVFECLEGSKDWDTTVREIRNLLAHRQHNLIIIGGPEEGPIFQVEEHRLDPKIQVPFVAWKSDGQNHEFVDFLFYATWILAEILVLLDGLGAIIASEVGIVDDISGLALRRGDFQVFCSALDRLIERAGRLSIKEGGI